LGQSTPAAGDANTAQVTLLPEGIAAPPKSSEWCHLQTNGRGNTTLR